MIKEAIQFVETYEGKPETSSKERLINQIAKRYSKIAIINVELGKNSLLLKDNPILLASEPGEELSNLGFKDTRKWLNKYSDDKLLERLNFEGYIDAMTEYRKCIGSISGLMSFSLFHFRTRAEWLFDSEKGFRYPTKINETKLNKEDLSTIKAHSSNEQKSIIDIINSIEGVIGFVEFIVFGRLLR